MQSEPYIADRLTPKIVAAYCKREGIDFRAFSDEWVLRLAKGDLIRWIVGNTFDLNGSAAGDIAQDKVATYILLHAAGIKAVPHYLVRSFPRELVHAQELHDALDDVAVVAKPLAGMAGRDVNRFGSVGEALSMIRSSGEPAWALSPHVDVEAEYRLIMLDDVLLLSYEKTQPYIRSGLKLFNLSLGALPTDIENDALERQLTGIAQAVMRTMALRLAAVDIVRVSDQTLKVLEVNDSISTEHYARHSANNKKRATALYERLVVAMFNLPLHR
ncbi:MAG TPA: hypothetical protein VMB52_05555 [Verrucomicrobiae bacterium]|nr:hypothetical protein [Verrucomicrobiae bacterium]